MLPIIVSDEVEMEQRHACPPGDRESAWISQPPEPDERCDDGSTIALPFRHAFTWVRLTEERDSRYDAPGTARRAEQVEVSSKGVRELRVV